MDNLKFNFNDINLLLDFYITNLNKKSINIERENYFLSQLKYEKVPIVGENLARFLFIVSYLFCPKTILEIGYGSGYSSYSIYSGIFERLKSDIEKIDFISLERNHIRYERGIRFINSKNLNIKLFYEDFDEWVNFFDKEEYFDFIFVDSVKKNYLTQFHKIIKLLKRGGIIIFDNIFFEGKVIKLKKNQIPKYCDTSNKLNYFNHYLAQNNEIYVNFLKIDDGIAFCIKK